MEYKTEFNEKGGRRYDISNPPKSGTEMIDDMGDEVVFDEVGPAGMLMATRKKDGIQNLYHPHELLSKAQ